MADKHLYTEDSIESLSPLEFTRLRPGVYCGDTTFSTQLLVEIVSNAIDEFRLGHGNVINVGVNVDAGVCTVTDYGQGFIPASYREDGKSILEAAFSVLNTSGKYREDGTYEGTSLGSFGIGSKITTYLSNWLNVTTCRDGVSETVRFEEGEFSSRSVHDCDKTQHGTSVQWHPSPEFFTHTEVDIEAIKKLFKVIACLCPGLTINLDYITYGLTGQFQYASEKGLHDLVDEAVGDKELLKNRFSMNFENGKNKLDMVLTYTTNYSSTIIPYVNTGLTESGQHITQIKTIITREMNKFFKEKKWLKDKDENLTGDDIQEGLYVVFNITAPNVAYDAQVKSRVTKIDMTPFTADLVAELKNYFAINEKEIKIIADKAIQARKAREAAKAAREKVRDNAKKKREKALKFDSKLADCYSKDRKKCELYVTEGDSASGNLKSARNNEFQAVIPIRGKMLNCLKATPAQIQKNAEIMTIMDAIGLDMDPKTGKFPYDASKLRYGKIIIMSDGDSDGSHIKNLFYTDIWTLCPELILNGHIYAGIPPLYKVTIGASGKEYKYLKNDEALFTFREANKHTKYSVNRMKGCEDSLALTYFS